MMDTEIREFILEYSRLWCTKDLVRNDEELKKQEGWVWDRKKGSEGDWKQVPGRDGQQGGTPKSQAGLVEEVCIIDTHEEAQREKKIMSFIQV